MLSILELSDIEGKPKVKLDLPDLLRMGEKFSLCFCLTRMKQGRSERLVVKGLFQVTQVGYAFEGLPRRQILSIVAVGKTPHWEAVKKVKSPKVKLTPTHSGRTPVE